MKALALSNISLFEHAVLSLNAYVSVIETGLGACFREIGPLSPLFEQRIKARHSSMTAIVFGSDHGLVGQFNDEIAEFAQQQIVASDIPTQIYAVGERVFHRLVERGLPVSGVFPAPHSVTAITPLIGQILGEQVMRLKPDSSSELRVFYNQPTFGTGYNPASQQILPFDYRLSNQWKSISWPTKALPQVMGSGTSATSALIREFIFVALYRACALSLASENASRLAAMQRADQNIEELTILMKSEYHQLRQREIDEDLFDIISGYESQLKRR
jgi:F-type H+-transporting ATPase subunit gamma